jgi:hypothetical protein
VPQERQDGRLDVAGVGTQPVRQLRCAHADEVHVRPLGQLGDRRGEPEPTGRGVPAHETLEIGLEERQDTLGERVDLGRVHVVRDHLVPELGQARRVRHAEIPRPDDAD